MGSLEGHWGQGENATDHLLALGLPEARSSLVSTVVPRLLDGIANVAKALRSAQRVSLAGTANTFGDDQLNVDVLAEYALRDAVATCPTIVTASSEEDPVERAVHKGGTTWDLSNDTEQYTVAFDPLDGSSIIAPNWSVGTIISIWDGNTALNQYAAERQVAAILGVYGPRTTAIIAIRVPGSSPVCFEVFLEDAGTWIVTRAETRYATAPFKTRYFSPANLRAAAEHHGYMALVARFIENKYTLRYSGGLIPDVVHSLAKGHGIYTSPVTSSSKAKLRKLYELFPVALVIECAGGEALDPVNGKRILDEVLKELDERAGLICGTTEEVKLVKSVLMA